MTTHDTQPQGNAARGDTTDPPRDKICILYDPCVEYAAKEIALHAAANHVRLTIHKLGQPLCAALNEGTLLVTGDLYIVLGNFRDVPQDARAITRSVRDWAKSQQERDHACERTTSDSPKAFNPISIRIVVLSRHAAHGDDRVRLLDFNRECTKESRQAHILDPVASYVSAHTVFGPEELRMLIDVTATGTDYEQLLFSSAHNRLRRTAGICALDRDGLASDIAKQCAVSRFNIIRMRLNVIGITVVGHIDGVFVDAGIAPGQTMVPAPDRWAAILRMVQPRALIGSLGVSLVSEQRIKTIDRRITISPVPATYGVLSKVLGKAQEFGVGVSEIEITPTFTAGMMEQDISLRFSVRGMSDAQRGSLYEGLASMKLDTLSDSSRGQARQPPRISVSVLGERMTVAERELWSKVIKRARMIN